MLEKLAKLREEVLSKIDGSKNIEELNELKVKILGKKGEFTTIMKGMSEISAEKRAEFGKTTNEIKSLLNERFENNKKVKSRGNIYQKTLIGSYIFFFLTIMSFH